MLTGSDKSQRKKPENTQLHFPALLLLLLLLLSFYFLTHQHKACWH